METGGLSGWCSVRKASGIGDREKQKPLHEALPGLQEGVFVEEDDLIVCLIFNNRMRRDLRLAKCFHDLGTRDGSLPEDGQIWRRAAHHGRGDAAGKAASIQ